MATARTVAECDKQAARLVSLIRLTELDPDVSTIKRDARCKVYRRELDRVLDLRLRLAKR